ncbi:MAG: hypothetical protein A2840_00010 [Candidatus Buchananbacteria bacterium RIFCSPHIGHO2_01_FULL_47_11b]|uniref:Uncharacterized protein n=1 Tax=Candidatus Buchananbacteria bacterium RIFCSPHIGHO2_01_FULL_47_11b TaxID=1797537 RepID=A0A1G1Y530_9BACT|nr:MAG: hypothetical protein A2840_00010 [Candidatus Buchananbacteria bacterium RIFCSPHIGHO2_01_FULL_47_11b]
METRLKRLRYETFERLVLASVERLTSRQLEPRLSFKQLEIDPSDLAPLVGFIPTVTDEPLVQGLWIQYCQHHLNHEESAAC